MSTCYATAFACCKTKRAVPWERLLKRRRRRKSCKTCRLKTTTSFSSGEKKNKVNRLKKKRRLRLNAYARRKRKSKSTSGTKTSSIKKWPLWKKFVDRRSKSSITCTECVKISTIRLSSVSSKSGKPSHKAWPNKMNSLRISGLKPDTTSNCKLTTWQVKLMDSRRRALNWNGLRTNSCANFKRLKSRREQHSSVWRTLWSMEVYHRRCAQSNQFRCRLKRLADKERWVEVNRLLKVWMKQANLNRMQMASEWTIAT